MSIDSLARTPVLLVAVDFDGTLAPLVDDPMTARMTASARSAIDELRCLPHTYVALVSGRSLADLRVIAEHTDDSDIVLAGSHGAEFWMPGVGALTNVDPSAAAVRDALADRVESVIADVRGAWVERKTFGFAVHSRLVDEAIAPEVHRRADAIVAAAAPSWRRREGHHITEYAFRAEGKDTAIAMLRQRLGATAVLFAGDDVTDEDALASLADGDVGVRVSAGDTAATVRVHDIAELAGLLSALATERARAQE